MACLRMAFMLQSRGLCLNLLAHGHGTFEMYCWELRKLYILGIDRYPNSMSMTCAWALVGINAQFQARCAATLVAGKWLLYVPVRSTFLNKQ